MYAFVNFSHPEQQRSKAARKAIKAFTTKTNHARRRQRALEENARLPSKDSGSSSSSAAGDRDAPEDEVEAIVRRTDWNDVVIVKVPDWRESPLVKRSQKRLLDSSLLSPEGRFRDDPFGSFPVVSDPYLTDYFINTFAPQFVWRREGIETGSLHKFKHDIFQILMSEPYWYLGVMAICQAMIDLQSGTGQLSRKALLYHANCIATLTKKLNGPKAHEDDAVLLTVITLATWEQIFQNWSHFEAHLRGIRQLVAMRGGLDKLGLQGFPKIAITSFELRLDEVGSEITKLEPLAPLPTPTYPDHPFPPDLCRLLAKLPRGFVDLITSRPVCLEVVQSLVNLIHLSDPKHEESEGSKSYHAFVESRKWIMMVKWPLNEMEGYLCVGVLAYLDGFKGNNFRPMTHTAVERPVSQLQRCVLWQVDIECTMWIAVMIATLNDSEDMPLQNRWLLFDQLWDWDSRFRHWSVLVTILEKYFWTEQFTKDWYESWMLGKQRNMARWHTKTVSGERPP